jgi:hypothetical protein
MMSDWSGIGVGGGWGDGSDGRLLAENAELTDRLRRMGPALANIAHELARARRENAALKRENLRLEAARRIERDRVRLRRRVSHERPAPLLPRSRLARDRRGTVETANLLAPHDRRGAARAVPLAGRANPADPDRPECPAARAARSRGRQAVSAGPTCPRRNGRRAHPEVTAIRRCCQGPARALCRPRARRPLAASVGERDAHERGFQIASVRHRDASVPGLVVAGSMPAAA